MVFLERTVDITIAGFGTEFSDPQLDFGAADITVNDITVASGTGLVANITIADDATLGYRDVTVSDGGVDYVYTDAFYVEAPLAYQEIEGSVAQGGIMFTAVEMLDDATPFDTSLGGALTTFSVAGQLVDVLEVAPYSAYLAHYTDINATPGAVDIVADSNNDGFVTTSRSPGAVTIEAAASAPTVLTLNTPEYLTVPNGDFVTVVAEVTFSANSLGQIGVRPYTVNPNAAPNWTLIPASGAYSDFVQVGGGPFLMEDLEQLYESILGGDYEFAQEVQSGPAGDKYYVVISDDNGFGGYDVEITATEVSSDEVEPNNACADAQDLGTLSNSSFTTIANLAFSNVDDEDWYEIDVPASAVTAGEGVRVISYETASFPEAFTDTKIEIYESDCTTLVEESDADAHEDVLTRSITTAGTYYVRVQHSPEFVASSLSYDLDVILQASTAEPTPEGEPNDSEGDADNNNAFTDSFVGSGEIFPVGDIDYWAITPAATGTMDVTVLDGEFFSCSNDESDPALDINDGAVFSNDDSDGLCPALSSVPVLASTPIYVVVYESPFAVGTAPEFDYELLVELQ